MKVRLLRKIRRDFILFEHEKLWYGLAKKNNTLLYKHYLLRTLIADITSSYYEKYSVVRDHHDRLEARLNRKLYKEALRLMQQ